MKTTQELLTELKMYPYFIEWASDKTIEEVVETCKQGELLEELAYKLGVSKNLRVLTSGLIAKLSQNQNMCYWYSSAVNCAIEYGYGLNTEENLKFHAKRAYECYYEKGCVHDLAPWIAANGGYGGDDRNMPFASQEVIRSHGRSNVLIQKLIADICRNFLGKAIIEAVKKQNNG